MNRIVLLIGIGGFLGSISRYGAGVLFEKLLPSEFPMGTFVVNVVGCLLIGLVYGLSERFEWMTSEWRMFLATGFCGGFTTFSSFAYENLRLLQSGKYWLFGWYSFGSFVLGLLAALVGFMLSKIIAP